MTVTSQNQEQERDCWERTVCNHTCVSMYVYMHVRTTLVVILINLVGGRNTNEDSPSATLAVVFINGYLSLCCCSDEQRFTVRVLVMSHTCVYTNDGSCLEGFGMRHCLFDSPFFVGRSSGDRQCISCNVYHKGNYN